MKEKYIKIETTNAENRPFIKDARCLCEICHAPFKLDKRKGWRGTEAIVTEEQISWFRGDDIVKFYHVECYSNLFKNESDDAKIQEARSILNDKAKNYNNAE